MSEPQAPSGYRIEWYPDQRCRPHTRGMKCRMPRCPEPAVMDFRRSNGWWAYCPEHTYGRRLIDAWHSYRWVPEAAA